MHQLVRGRGGERNYTFLGPYNATKENNHITGYCSCLFMKDKDLNSAFRNNMFNDHFKAHMGCNMEFPFYENFNIFNHHMNQGGRGEKYIYIHTYICTHTFVCSQEIVNFLEESLFLKKTHTL